MARVPGTSVLILLSLEMVLSLRENLQWSEWAVLILLSLEMVLRMIAYAATSVLTIAS